MKIVQPKVFMIGATGIDFPQIVKYLEYTDQNDFYDEMVKAIHDGVNFGEILCSFYAKLCYASLTNKKNKNISKTRDIANNILSVIDSQHGSVLEHCNVNFVVTDCSRVFTHELVRHRVGTAFSQTSGRYVRVDNIRFVFDPILEKVSKRLINLIEHIESEYSKLEHEMGLIKGTLNEVTDFDTKKQITSALRRVLPNGQANEIGFSVNIRTLRQTIEARTSRHAEWEIRIIFNQIYNLVSEKYKLMFSDVNIESVKGINEITFKNKKI